MQACRPLALRFVQTRALLVWAAPRTGRQRPGKSVGVTIRGQRCQSRRQVVEIKLLAAIMAAKRLLVFAQLETPARQANLQAHLAS